MPVPLRIAVVLETFNEHGRAVMRGIANYLDRGSTWELHTMPLGRNGCEILKSAMQADGIITRPYTSDMAELMYRSGKPGVAVHYRGEFPIPTVTCNAARVAEIAAEHLVEQGFKHFAFFGAEKHFSSDRQRAFERAVRTRGFSFDINNSGTTEPEDFAWHTTNEPLVRWLRDLPKPVGILAANDVMAQQLLLTAPHAGVRVPDDVAVVGVDNDEIVCRLSSPRLSSIDDAGERVGFVAASILDQLLKGEPLQAERFYVDPIRLVVRQSSDVLAVSNPAVAAAVRFIRENTGMGLGVEDVLRKVPVARRTLELNFKKLLGRSIHEEIMQSRVRRARQLLTETELSVDEITTATGFCNRGHLSEIFKLATGHAPAQYRRAFRTPRWTGNPSTNVNEVDIPTSPATNAQSVPLQR